MPVFCPLITKKINKLLVIGARNTFLNRSFKGEL